MQLSFVVETIGSPAFFAFALFFAEERADDAEAV
jgi:hypothetical protein